MVGWALQAPLLYGWSALHKRWVGYESSFYQSLEPSLTHASTSRPHHVVAASTHARLSFRPPACPRAHLLCRSRVIEGCLDVLDPETAPGDTSHLVGSHARSLSPGPGGSSGSDARAEAAALGARLGRLPGQEFMWVLEAVLLASKVYINHCTAVGEAVQMVLTAAKASKQQLAAAAQGSRQCCQAVAEVVAGRWSKLLAGRARGAEGANGRSSGGSSGIRCGHGGWAVLVVLWAGCAD